ncbi:hypothetical protein [Azospirillum baldaniorum]|nr:hypothetical protein [Azospirillum baldaniorum]
MRTLALAAVIVCVASAASAEWVSWRVVGGWEIETNGISCIAGAKYKNGSRLSFAIANNGGAAISFFRSEWKIPEGVYSVYLSMDGRNENNYEAKGVDNSVIISFRLNETFIEAFRNGNVLSARIGSAFYQYNLTNTKQMLPELIRCAANLGDVNRESNPFSGNSAPYVGDRVIRSPNPFQ